MFAHTSVKMYWLADFGLGGGNNKVGLVLSHFKAVDQSLEVVHTQRQMGTWNIALNQPYPAEH